MSGHKRATISISEEEYRRLHDAEMKLRFAPHRTPDSSRIEQEIQNSLTHHLEDVHFRQEEFAKFLSAIDEHISDTELRTDRELAMLQENIHHQITSAVGNLIEESENLIACQYTKFQDLMEQEQQARISDTLKLEQSINNLEASNRHRQAFARQWIENTVGMFNFIQDHYQHHLFAPGKLERLANDINLAIQNYDSGLPEAASAHAQLVYSQLSELRVECEKLDLEWTTLLQAAKEGIDQLLMKTRLSQTISAHDLDGNELPILIDLDYWSNGQITATVQTLEALEISLSEVFIPISDLKRIIREELPKFNKALEEAIYQARLSVLNSQLRINIADLVIEALGTQGYRLEEADYLRKDFRMAFSAKVRNIEGNEIVVQVNPSDTVGKNELHLVSLDRERRTEHELRQRSLEVSRALKMNGLMVDHLRQFEHKSNQPSQPRTRQKNIQHSASRLN